MGEKVLNFGRCDPQSYANISMNMFSLNADLRDQFANVPQLDG